MPCRFCVVMTVTVISFRIVLFLLWLRSVDILSFIFLWRWISLVGLGAYSGMVGYLSFGPKTLPMVLVTFLLVLTLLISLRIGGYRWGSMLRVLLSVWLLSLVSGLMGAWRIRSLVSLGSGLLYWSHWSSLGRSLVGPSG